MSTTSPRRVIIHLLDRRIVEGEVVSGDFTVEGISFSVDRLEGVYASSIESEMRVWRLVTDERIQIPTGKAQGTVTLRIPGTSGEIVIDAKDIRLLLPKK